MKHGVIWAVVCLLAGMGASAGAQQQNQKWLGVWQSRLHGQPGVIVTLGDDTGPLGGTIVLNMIQNKDGTARVIHSEAHVLRSPRMSEGMLAFGLKRQRAPYSMMDFTMVLKADSTATIHCTNCKGAPTVELTREW